MDGKQEEIHNILVALLSGKEEEIYNVLYKKKAGCQDFMGPL